MLCYWLTNTVTLCNMLAKNVKPASGGSKARPGVSSMAGARTMLGSLLGRSSSQTSGGLAHAEASIHGGGVGGFKAIEAKYPALMFKQQLDAFVQKIFPMIRDNMRKEIAPMLTNCIHTPKPANRTVGARVGAPAAGGLDRSSSANAAGGAGNALKSWTDILVVLDKLMGLVKDHNVPRILAQVRGWDTQAAIWHRLPECSSFG